MGWFARRFGARKTAQIEVQFIGMNTQAFLDAVFRSYGVHVMDVDFSAESSGEGMHYTNVYSIELTRGAEDCKTLREALMDHSGVRSVRIVS